MRTRLVLVLLALCPNLGFGQVLPQGATYWGSLLYLSLFGSVIAFAAYFTLIHRIGAQKAVYIGVVTPVISVLLSIRFEHYRPGAVEWLGMAVCLAGVAWALRTDEPAAAAPITEPAADTALAELPLARSDEARSELETLLGATGDHLCVLRVLADLDERLGDALAAAPLWLRASALSTDREEAADLARRACQAHLDGRYELEVIDLYQEPSRAAAGQIIASPTLIKILPKPLMRMVGNLADREQLLIKLDLGGPRGGLPCPTEMPSSP
jgi:drug/metabolite transporter superfamily protein YnfA